MKKFLLCASAFALLLGSCSKDDADSAAVEVKGKVAFSASMTIGEGVSTRTHLETDETGKYKYYWDDGDMIGATINGGDEIVPFIVAKGGTDKAQFTVVDEDLAYLGDPAYYLVYPYDKEAKVSGQSVTLTIPASQRYRDNSFATMTAPAVAVIADEYDSETTLVTMQPVASYVRVPVTGAGKLTGLELTVKNSAGKYVKLNGEYNVSLKSIETAVASATVDGVDDSAADADNKVSIAFGNGGIDLKYEEPAYLWFVVPANMPLKSSTLTFTATVNGDQVKAVEIEVPATASATLVRNQYLAVPTISVGTENMVMINTTEDFMKYAYQVNLGVDAADATYVYGDGTKYFKTAVLLNSLSFRNYDAGQKYSENAALGAEKDVILEAALQAYMANGGFASLQGGANIDGNGNSISYMTVNGNGLFAKAAASLKNVTFSNVTVTVPDGQKTPALFAGVLPGATAVSNVKFAGGYLKNVAEGVVPAMISSASATTLPTAEQIAITSYPRVNETSDYAYYAATLTVNGNVVASDADKKAYFGTVRRFGVIKGSKSGAVISKVAAGAAVENIIAAVDPKSTRAFSVTDTRNTSYWTGLVASVDAVDGSVDTAEELAYYVKNGGTVTLAGNIDLQGEQGKTWVLDNGSAELNITGNGKYTISNALVKSQKVTEAYVAYSLLGNVVNAKDIVVDGVTIDVDNVEGATAQLYVGGLGYQGSANGVKVSNMAIDVAADVEVSTYNELGGLISVPTAASEGNTVSELSINVNKNETVGLVGGMFAKAPESFGNNVVASYAAEAAPYALIGDWTISADADVTGCKNVAEVPVIASITVNAAGNGQTLILNFKECTEPFYGKMVNPNDYLTIVKVNGENVEVKPE